MARSGRPVARETVRFVWLADGRVRRLAGVRRGIGGRREDELAARSLLEYRRRCSTDVRGLPGESFLEVLLHRRKS